MSLLQTSIQGRSLAVPVSFPLLLFAVGYLADLLTTSVGLAVGLSDFNPILSSLSASHATVVVFGLKVTGFFLITGLTARMSNGLLSDSMLIASGCLCLLVSIYNIYQIAMVVK